MTKTTKTPAKPTFWQTLYEPVPAHSIVFLRIFWGFVMFYEMYTYCTDDYAKTYHQLVAPKFMFKYYGFHWIPRLTFEQWQYFNIFLMVMALCFSAGFLFRFSAFAFAFGFTFLYLQDMTFYLNHYYLTIVLCFCYALLPANHFFSVDVALGLVKKKRTVPYWTVGLTRLLVSVVYVYAGIAKMNEDWIRGVPLSHWVPRRAKKYPLFAPILSSYENALAMSWGGMLFDTFVPFAMMIPAIRPFAFFCSFSFHALNKLIFNIGIFPWLMCVITTQFFAPDWPLNIGSWMVGVKKDKMQPEHTEEDKKCISRFNSRVALSTSQKLWLGFLTLFIAQQTLMPLRHNFYKGQVVWNEEGHLMSWRMKLRDKAGMTKFYIELPKEETPEETEIRVINPYDFLTGKQVRKMNGRPQMILQFVEYLKNIVEEELALDGEVTYSPKIYVLSIGSVNYRTPQLMIDPTIDLAKEEPWSWSNEWVLDLLPLGTTEHFYVPPNPKPTNKSGKERLYDMYGHLTLSEAQEWFAKAKAAEAAGKTYEQLMAEQSAGKEEL